MLYGKKRLDRIVWEDDGNNDDDDLWELVSRTKGTGRKALEYMVKVRDDIIEDTLRQDVDKAGQNPKHLAPTVVGCTINAF